MKKYLILTLVLCLLAACGGEPTPTPDLVATQIAVEDCGSRHYDSQDSNCDQYARTYRDRSADGYSYTYACAKQYTHAEANCNPTTRHRGGRICRLFRP